MDTIRPHKENFVNPLAVTTYRVCSFSSSCSPLYSEGEPLVLRFVRSLWVLFTAVQRRWTFGVTFCSFSVSSFHHCTEKVSLWCYVLFVLCEFFGFRCCRTRPCCSWEGWSWRWRWRRWIYIGGSPSASSPWWDPNLICKQHPFIVNSQSASKKLRHHNSSHIT